MALQVLLVFLAMLLTTETERSKHLSTGDQFCLCGDSVVRIRVSSMDEKESFPVSCDERCRAETKTEMKFRSLRRRRDIDQKENECHNISSSPPRWIVSNVTVAFHEIGNSSDWYAKVSWPLTDFSEPWRGYCIFYTFDKNTIEAVPDKVFLQKNQTSINITSKLYQKQIFLKVVALPMSPNTNSTYRRIAYDGYHPTDTYQERSTSTPSEIQSQYSTKSFTTMSKSTECRAITTSPPRMIASNVIVAFHERGNGSGWYAKVSWSPLTDSFQPWRGYCLFYSFGENIIDVLNDVFLQKNQTSINITSTFYKRQIYLSVIALPMSPNSSYPEFYLNPYRPTVTGQEFIPNWTKSFTTTKSPDTVTYVSISIGTIVGLALVVGLLVYFKRPKKDSIPLPLEFQYHAFIIYNNEDRLWMKNKLLPFLEGEHHLTCCTHYRNFVPGRPFRDNMVESVYKSHKVIALFSSNFVKSSYCKYELDLAIGRLVKQRDHSLIVIRIDKVDCEQLPTELQKNSFIDYSDLFERRLWKRKLLGFLGQLEDYQSLNVTVEQNSDNNNTHDLGENRARIGFNRLESTTSTDTVISTC